MNEDYISPATSRLIRCRITVSVSSSSNQSIQQHRRAISDTQENRAHVHLPHDQLVICKNGRMQCNYDYKNKEGMQLTESYKRCSDLH